MRASNKKKVLISGASFAGLSCAWWMNQLGYEVTVVEVGNALRLGGTAVDIRDNTVDVVRRMGILDAIRANRLSLQRWEFKNARDETERCLQLRGEGDPPSEEEFEIERTVLLNILYDAVLSQCQFIFGDRVVGLNEAEDSTEVTFSKSAPGSFALVLGCDGMHSGVRKLCFGDESQYSHFLGQYFSVTIVDKLLIAPDTAQMFNVPGKVVMLNAYKNKTDIIFAFASDNEISYDRRDEQQQRGIIQQTFGDVAWRTPELLKEVEGSKVFYFDKLAQIRMAAWSRGRVALVGDAGYCPSPAAGMGGSLAIDGAAAFADAMRAHPDDHAQAFREYETKLRPFITHVQTEAVRFGLETLVPRTEEAIRERNAKTGMGF